MAKQKEFNWTKSQRVNAIDRLQLPRGIGVSRHFLKGVLMKLEDKQGGKSECWPSQRYLCSVLNCSERQLRKALNWLSDQELIAKELRWEKGKTQNYYSILWGNLSVFNDDRSALFAGPIGTFCRTDRHFLQRPI